MIRISDSCAGISYVFNIISELSDRAERDIGANKLVKLITLETNAQ